VSAWLGVVSRGHVVRGVAGGFAQVCHGKERPLRRMKTGDWLVYYSPAIEMGGAPLRAFTAIGQVEDDDVFRFDMGGSFVPFRRRVRYAAAREVPLDAVRDRLELCARPDWGIVLRRGLVPLSAIDLAVIGAAMGVRCGHGAGADAA
jgi:hypothetical protein